MNIHIHIDDDLIGEVELRVIDESMWVVGGNLIPTPLYQKYQAQIQVLYNTVGIAGMRDFNFKAIFQGLVLDPQGGIGITDSEEFNEIYVDIAGVDMSKFRL